MRPDSGTLARVAAGPLALAAFFLPWGRGVGVLAQAEFSGLSLVRFTGEVAGAGIGGAAELSAVGVRVAALAYVVAATWHTILAPAWRWHAAYTATGLYLVGAAMVIVLAHTATRGAAPLAPGALLALLAASLFVAAQANLLSSRLRLARLRGASR